MGNIKEDNLERSRTLGRRIADAYNEMVKPTHFVTLSLCQARYIQSEKGLVTRVAGDDVLYTQTANGFIRSLSKRLTNRARWQKHKPLLGWVVAIEGDGRNERYHFHCHIAKPPAITDEAFCEAIYETAAGNPWIMNGKNAVHINLVSNSDARRTGFYSLKRGPDRVLA